jgi:vitamin B12/bleomycin/antimicrobial peptide transport system ATP-binding/permease protein
MLGQIRAFLRDLWSLTKPYFVSEERWSAWGLLVLLVALNLGQVYMLILFNQWYNVFYNALVDKNGPEFWRLIGLFSIYAVIYVALYTYYVYLLQALTIRWRRWLTRDLIDDWLADRHYYRLALTSLGTDNPDQRIAEDVHLFVESTLGYAFNFMRNMVSLVSFMVILWALSGTVTLSLFGVSVDIPRFMVWMAIAYAVIGTILTHFIGRRLAAINFERQRREADFRFSLMRLRENAEGIALYGGEKSESGILSTRFAAVIDNYWQYMKYTKRVNWFTTSYSQASVIFPFIIQAPRYLTDVIKLGDLIQTASAFGKVQDALSWFVDRYADLTVWKATIDRLTTFRAALVEAGKQPDRAVQVSESSDKAIAIDDLAMDLPNGKTLISGLDITFKPGEAVLITGQTGTGKSTLLRILSRLWPFGAGKVTLPAGARYLFLPQKPYLPLGTLRDAIAYPDIENPPPDDQVGAVLEELGMGSFKARLDESQNWATVLSGGEQQRVAIARAVFQKPDWLFMDEATAALDEPTEKRVYEMVKRIIPGATIVSVGHRSTLRAFHDRNVDLKRTMPA